MNRSRAIIVAIVVTMVAALAVGVASRDSSSLSSSAQDSAQRAASEPSTDDDALPSFTGTTFDGKQLSDSDIKGPAVIHVFASWCPSCTAEAPEFARLQKARPDFNYYFLAVDDDRAANDAFKQEHGWIDGPTIDDASRSVEQKLGLTGQPHTIFVDAEGNTTVHQGPGRFLDLDALASRIA